MRRALEALQEALTLEDALAVVGDAPPPPSPNTPAPLFSKAFICPSLPTPLLHQSVGEGGDYEWLDP